MYYKDVIKELENFQKILDNPKKKLLVKDLRGWAGHINFLLTELLVQIKNILEEAELTPNIEKTVEESNDIKRFYQ